MKQDSIRRFKHRVVGFSFLWALVVVKIENRVVEEIRYADKIALTLRVWTQSRDENTGEWDTGDLGQQPRFEMTSNERGELEIYSTGLTEIDEFRRGSEYKYFYQLKESESFTRFGRIEFLSSKLKQIPPLIEDVGNKKFEIEIWNTDFQLFSRQWTSFFPLSGFAARRIVARRLSRSPRVVCYDREV